MPKSKAPADSGGEVREVIAAEMKSYRKARAAMPASLRRKVGLRGAGAAPLGQPTFDMGEPNVDPTKALALATEVDDSALIEKMRLRATPQ